VIDSLLSSTISRLHLSEDWANLPLVFLHNPIATVVFDEATWLISAANPSACRLYGFASSELLGRSILDLVKKPAASQFGPTEFELKAMFLSRSEPWAHQGKDGREILVETVAHAVTWKSKSAHILYVNDKTESMLAQQQLLDALNKMEAALRAKTQFLSTISHEIRTPLNGVLGMTDMLSETELDHEQRDFVSTIKASGEQLLSIIDDILDFTKAEQNKLILEMRDFDLRKFMEAVVEIVEIAARQKGLLVGVFIAPDVPMNLIGDSARLKQILMNLLTNAVKFTEEGGIQISIRQAEETNLPKLLFEIRDSGIGIPAERQAQLFQGFGQVDSSLTRRFGGTGLGLAISKRLVNLMSGEIGVTSEPGQGSTFWFTSQFLLGAKPAPRSYCGGSASILLVEDNVVNQKVASNSLHTLGYAFEVAANGLQAVTAFKQRPFDLVLMDCHMPVMDGYTATQKIRACGASGRYVPIIAMTADVVETQRERCIAAGMNDFLSKPVKRDVLGGVLEHWLARGEQFRYSQAVL
jgi:two-component system, sensor histidine kinase and response regulator